MSGFERRLNFIGISQKKIIFHENPLGGSRAV
jgi:hypothetical protein